jgi:hypothetical protein
MLIVLAHNDGTGSNESANYNVEVRINEGTIWKGRIEGHDRSEGWTTLLYRIANAGKEADGIERS